MEDLIDQYVNAAYAQGHASESGDFKTANLNSDLVCEIAAELKARGTVAQEALLTLFQHDDPYVRVWSAAHSLNFVPAEAEQVLEKIASDGPGVFRLTAEMTLREWRAGRLHLS